MTPFSLALLALCTATAAGAIPVTRAPEPDMLTLSSASIVSTCDIGQFTWTLPSDNPSVEIANIVVHNTDSSITRSIAQPASRETSVEWTVDVPPGSYVVVADLADKDESVRVVNAAFTVQKGADMSCLHADETSDSESSPTTPAAPTTPSVAENVESAPTPTPTPESTGKRPSPGAIAGLIVGILILLVVGGACVWRWFGARERVNEQYPLPPAVHRSKTSDDRRDSESTVVDIEVVARAPTPLGMASMTKLGRTQSKPLVAELDTEQTQKMLRQLK